jgi:hypothetical protein
VELEPSKIGKRNCREERYSPKASNTKKISATQIDRDQQKEQYANIYSRDLMEHQKEWQRSELEKIRPSVTIQICDASRSDKHQFGAILPAITSIVRKKVYKKPSAERKYSKAFEKLAMPGARDRRAQEPSKQK